MSVDFSHRGYEWGVGIAYTACPKDIDREEYLKDCFLNHRISIKTEDGGYYNRVPVGIDVLQHLDFPKEEDELGVAVVYITESQHKQPIVIARLPKIDQVGDGREGMLKIGKSYGVDKIEIIQDAKNGFLHFDVNAGKNQGIVKFNVDNDKNDCLFGIDVSGSIIAKSTQFTYLHSEEGFTSIVSENGEDDEDLSIIRQDKARTLIGGGHVILNGNDIEIVHYKGYKIIINENGIIVDSLDKDVIINAQNSCVKLEDGRVDIESESINLNGSFEVLYNKTPGFPITDISQIGCSKKVKVG